MISAVLVACATPAVAQTPTPTPTPSPRSSPSPATFATPRPIETRPSLTAPQTGAGAVRPVTQLSAEDRRRQEASSERRRQSAASGDPDVLLDIPNLSVEEITLEVQN